MGDSMLAGRRVVIAVIVSTITVSVAQLGLSLLNMASLPGIAFPWRSVLGLIASVCIGALLLTRQPLLRWLLGSYYCVIGTVSLVIAYQLAQVFLGIGPVVAVSFAGAALGVSAVSGVTQVVSGLVLLLHPGARQYFGPAAYAPN